MKKQITGTTVIALASLIDELSLSGSLDENESGYSAFPSALNIISDVSECGEEL